MPTIFAIAQMVGTLRFAHPSDCELICFARKRNLVRSRDKSTRRANHFFQNLSSPVRKNIPLSFSRKSVGITPPVSRRMRGVGHRHERAVRCDGRESCD